MTPKQHKEKFGYIPRYMIVGYTKTKHDQCRIEKAQEKRARKLQRGSGFSALEFNPREFDDKRRALGLPLL